MKKYFFLLLLLSASLSFSQTASIKAGRLSSEIVRDAHDNFGEIPFSYQARNNPDTLWVLSDTAYAIVKYEMYTDQMGHTRIFNQYRDTIVLGSPGSLNLMSEEFRKSFGSHTVFIYQTVNKKLNRKMNGAIKQNGLSGWWFLLIGGLLVGLHARERRRI